jgi:hypothetical protein
MVLEDRFILSLAGFYEEQKRSNMYTKFDENGRVVLISLYVDDLIITRNSKNNISGIKKQMSLVFEMKYLSELHYCLGL